MGQVYGVLATIHNAVGGITLLLTLAAAALLLFTARTTSSGSALVLRVDSISASLQGALGILLVITGLIIGNTSYIVAFWYHYVMGFAAVGLVSVMAARARRAPDSAARRYGFMFVGVLAVVLITFLIGQFGRGGA